MNSLITSAYQLTWTKGEDAQTHSADLPRGLWPAQVWAGSKWAHKLRPNYPAIDAIVAAKLAAYAATNA